MPNKVFGQRVSPSIAQQVLQSATLNANPSPQNPQQQPSDALNNAYARLLHSVYEVRRTEKDPMVLKELENVVSFAERRHTELAERNDDELVGTPAPIPPQPQAAPGPMLGQSPTPGPQAVAPPQAPPGNAAQPPPPMGA